MEQMNLISIVALSLSSNMDNLGVGVAYGIRGVDVPFATNLLIAFITGSGTLVSMLFGHTIGSLLRPGLANSIAGLIFIAIGSYVFATSVRKNNPVRNRIIKGGHRLIPILDSISRILDDPVCVDRDLSHHIDLREGVLLALALTINNVTNGVAAGMAGLSPSLTSMTVIVFSLLTLSTGVLVGRKCGRRWVDRYGGTASGLLLVSLGIYEILA